MAVARVETLALTPTLGLDAFGPIPDVIDRARNGDRAAFGCNRIVERFEHERRPSAAQLGAGESIVRFAATFSAADASGR